MEDNGIIIRPEALTEDFVPERMFSRDGQMQQMAACLAPLSEGRQPRSMLIYGPPGTGKTCMSRYVLEQLAGQATFSTAYVNCWNFETRFKILFTILQKLGADPSKHRVGTPIDEIIEALAKKASSRKLVVILDEVDRLADEKAVYDLFSVGACLIMIANDETAMYKWDQRIRSRLSSAERIPFQKYRPDELEGILKDRAEWALVPGSVSIKDIVRIAEAANGDARAAIAALRSAAEKAESAGKAKITQNLVPEPVGVKEREPELSQYQEAALKLLKKGPLSSGDLLDGLNRLMSEPVAERTFRKHMESLVRRGLIASEGEGRWRKYSVV
jgi:Cdc6-like AAA superfamily ATPase